VVEPQRSGMASGINNTFRQVGIATGIAGLGALLEHLMTSKLGNQIPGQALATGNPHLVPPAMRHAYLAAYTESLDTLLLVGGLTCLTGAVLAFALVRQRDFVASRPPETAEASAAA
jgi:hypothetical protein